MRRTKQLATFPRWVAICAGIIGFLLPLKAARVELGGLSIYFAYLVIPLALLVAPANVFGFLTRRMATALLAIALFAAWAVATGAGLLDPLVAVAKLLILFLCVASFGVLLRLGATRSLYRGLFFGVSFSVAYMCYQYVSGVFFGFRLPYTSIAKIRVGYGLSERYGLVRVTGFTEEPSFIATLLVGATLLLFAYTSAARLPRMRNESVFLGCLGLALCSSNNLFASIAIVTLGCPLIYFRRVGFLLVLYYIAAILVTPYVLFRDQTFFARFSAYDIFLRSNAIEMILGHGVGSYPQFFRQSPVIFRGLEVTSLASLWGGVLFEGGLVGVGLVLFWIDRLLRRTSPNAAFACLSLLLMLSNYNSPWWPMVALALAECFKSSATTSLQLSSNQSRVVHVRTA